MDGSMTIAEPEATVAGPETIFAGVASAIGKVRKLGKSERNKFDGYDFVSIDKFFELVNPLCAEAGLFPLVNVAKLELYENTNSKGSKSTWGRFTFEITLWHRSGESIGPVTSIVSVPMNGAQASGSAQSYALKQFFRGVLMIPTGDKDDADFAATEQHRGQSTPKADDKPYRDTKAVVKKLIADIDAIDDAEACNSEAIAKAFDADWKALSDKQREWLTDRIQKRAGTLSQAPTKDDDLTEVPF